MQVCWRCMNRSSKDAAFGKVRAPVHHLSALVRIGL